MTRFIINKDTKVVEAISSIPLNGREGYYIGEDIAFFYGKGKEQFIVNTKTGKIRTLVDAFGNLKIEDKDIDYEAIYREHENYFRCVSTKTVEFGSISRWEDFKKGLCALCWTTYPDGMYFADEDGFGAEDNEEENVFCIIDSNLEIVEPFRPMGDVARAILDHRNKPKKKHKHKNFNGK